MTSDQLSNLSGKRFPSQWLQQKPRAGSQGDRLGLVVNGSGWPGLKHAHRGLQGWEQHFPSRRMRGGRGDLFPKEKVRCYQRKSTAGGADSQISEGSDKQPRGCRDWFPVQRPRWSDLPGPPTCVNFPEQAKKKTSLSPEVN